MSGHVASWMLDRIIRDKDGEERRLLDGFLDRPTTGGGTVSNWDGTTWPKVVAAVEVAAEERVFDLTMETTHLSARVCGPANSL